MKPNRLIFKNICYFERENNLFLCKLIFIWSCQICDAAFISVPLVMKLQITQRQAWNVRARIQRSQYHVHSYRLLNSSRFSASDSGDSTLRRQEEIQGNTTSVQWNIRPKTAVNFGVILMRPAVNSSVRDREAELSLYFICQNSTEGSKLANFLFHQAVVITLEFFGRYIQIQTSGSSYS